jgi:hypothetical protein
MPAPTPAYSALLLQFVEPITTDVNTEEAVYQRCRLGMTVWNYHVSRKFNLQMFAAIEKVVNDLSASSPDFRSVFELLLERKSSLFDHYNNVILSVERRTRRDGTSTIYAVSAPYFAIAKTDVSVEVNKILGSSKEKRKNKMKMENMDVQLLHHVGNRLKTLRVGQGLSVEEVKAATGIAVAKIEAGEKDMKIDALAALCEHYQTSMVDFFKAIEKQLS